MDRLTSKQLRGLLDFVRGGYACLDREAFVTHLLHGVPTLISSEFVAYGQVNPGTGGVTEGRMEPANAGIPEWQQIFEQRMAEHPIVTYYQQTGDGGAVTISDFLTQSQWRQNTLYQDLYRPMRVENVMSTLLSVRPSCLIAVALHRGRRDFSERDRLLLNLLRRSQRRSR